jgi:hypothetical protein
MRRRFLITALLFATVSPLAYAHEGMIHVIGIVTALTNKSVTVETTDKKSIEVALTETTTYEKGTSPATWKDLKIRDRVVIHSVEVNKALQAHDIRFSEVTASSSH